MQLFTPTEKIVRVEIGDIPKKKLKRTFKNTVSYTVVIHNDYLSAK